MTDVTYDVDTTADPTQAGRDALAWSLETEPEPTPEPSAPGRSWPQAGSLAAALLALGALAAAATWYVNQTSPWSESAPPTVVQASRPPVPPPPDAPPPPVVLPTPPDAGHKLPPAPRAAVPPPTGAALFNLLLSRAGIDPPANPGDAEKAADETGHGICSSLADGYTEQDVIDSMLAKGHFGNGAAPTPAQARVFLQAAEQAYCPRLVG